MESIKLFGKEVKVFDRNRTAEPKEIQHELGLVRVVAYRLVRWKDQGQRIQIEFRIGHLGQQIEIREDLAPEHLADVEYAINKMCIQYNNTNCHG